MGAPDDVSFVLGDARDELARVGDEEAALVVTSPPYWNAKDYSRLDGEIGHGQSYADYLAALDAVWRECARVLRPNGKAAIVVQPLPYSPKGERSRILNISSDVEHQWRALGFDLSNLIIWDKRKYNNQRIFGSYPFPPNLFTHASYEFIHVFRKPGPTHRPPADIKEASKLSMEEWTRWCLDPVWDIPPVIKHNGTTVNRHGHDAPFPMEIPRRLIRLFSFERDLVVDPFVGSGTTLRACVAENRRGFGVELEPTFADLIRSATSAPAAHEAAPEVVREG